MNFKPFCSTEIEFTNIEGVKQRLLLLEITNIVLIMSESSAIRWNMLSFIRQLQMNCEKLSGAFIWLKNIGANPTQNDIASALQQIGDKEIETIIVFGGGSGIDLAKGISAFHNANKSLNCTNQDITDSILNGTYKDDNFIDIIAIPSTSGTGSEVTQWATIWDEDRKGKFSIDDPMLKPALAIIVPELTISMSAEMTLSTGLDALCQAIESYWSKHSTPIIQEIAYRAVEIIINNLRNAIDSPNDIATREKLCKSSVLAGLAFSQTRTTACHSISYPLTMHYNVPHGIAVALTLNEVAQINKEHFPNDVELFALFDKYGGIKNWIDIISKNVIDMRLSTFNIYEKDIPFIVSSSFTMGRMDNNPVELGNDDVIEILKSII